MRNNILLVYQAFNPAIAAYAAEHRRFGGPAYSFNRMSWIKPNFLWMMYRAGRAAKPSQERILAIEYSRMFASHIYYQNYSNRHVGTRKHPGKYS
ncbi:MAG TPA: DUF4291 family protein [Saprospiraceae bacterium]|nr:DUF4291 family protein [Saprospiraceae bacterium]HPI05241.1 DUF4291 family protein [Saprospiraceae bacterium]